METIKIVMRAAGGLALAIGATPAAAQSDWPRTERVGFADLDLSQPAGKTSLGQRIDAAARRVCFAEGDISLSSIIAAHDCYRTALADGLRQMNEIIAARASGTRLVTTALNVRDIELPLAGRHSSAASRVERRR